MTRALLYLSLIGAVLISASTARAAGMRPAPRHNLVPVLPLHLSTAARGSTLFQNRNAPERVSAAPTSQDAGSLGLPASVFSPATISSDCSGPCNGTEDNSTADENFFGQFHSTKYASLGRISGYYIRADWTLAGSGTVNFRYQASTFASASAAQAAQFDGVTHVQQIAGTTSQDCTSTVHAACNLIAFNDDSNDQVSYIAVQVNTCLLETSSLVPSTVQSANSSQISSILATITVAAVTNAQRVCNPGSPPPTKSPTPGPTQTVPTPVVTPTPPPAKVDFSIISVRIQKTAKDDWNLVKPPLTETQPGEKVTLAIYWILRSAPSDVIPTYALRITRGKHVIDEGTAKGTNPPYTADTYRVFSSYTFKKAGKYKFSGSVTLGRKTLRGSTTITVDKQIKPPPPPVSFSFDKIVAQNLSGHPETTFKAGQSLRIVASYTVRNLKATAPLWITRVYQYPGNGGWRPLGHPIIERSVTANGTHPYSVTIVPSPLYPKQRILLGITVGSHTQQKAVTISISR